MLTYLPSPATKRQQLSIKSASFTDCHTTDANIGSNRRVWLGPRDM